MAYFTYRTSGPRRVAAYTAANVRVIRRQAGRRVAIAPIGGEATDATRAELAAFFRAAAAEGSVGASLWEYGETTPRQWQTLAPSRSTFAASASR
jgi:hypothetical protein